MRRLSLLGWFAAALLASVAVNVTLAVKLVSCAMELR
jgi:hypothetical protein